MSLKIPSSGRKQFSSTMLLMQTPTSTTTAYVARKGDTLEKLATTLSIHPTELTTLNPLLLTYPTLTAGKSYKLPIDAATASMTAVNDIQIEYYARQLEAKAESLQAQVDD